MASTPQLSLLALAACLPLLPAQEPAPAAATSPAPQAKAPTGAEVLAGALRFTQGLPLWRCKAKGTFVMPELPEELAAQIDFDDLELPTMDLQLSAAQPRQFALRVDGTDFDRLEIVCDGKQILRSIGGMQVHSLGDAPAGLVPFLAAERGMMPLPGIANLRALLAPSGTPKALLDAKQVELVAETKVGDKAAWHLRVLDEALACEVWVQRGDQPWILRHKPKAPKLDFASLMGDDDDEDGDATTIQIEPAVDLEILENGRDVAETAFAIAEPAGSTRVDDLQATLMERLEAEMGEHEEEAEGPHASVGKPVPAVELSLLDGSKVRLSDLHGKVVVLDFWATWCGPCVQGLPKLAELTQRFAEQGVVFHAVNLGEGKATIEAFLAKKELKISVAMAGDELGEQFGVQGIPHTVIVGRDGVVRHVHVGFGPGTAKQLEQELQAAVTAKPGDTRQPPKDEPKPPKDEPQPAKDG
ncbi:MAG: TlpA family protein disulfide reductase [Planctomycetes bacterium]|nr:TlpA family protein disulfide reductase [Planctomycetota bacterium]